MSNKKIQRALISVSDKSGLLDLARALTAHGIEILSTGGTYRAIEDAGMPVIEVAQYTGFQEMMSGRVKTLHPKIHGGILGRRGVDDDVMQERDIPPIDLVVVNLYPFAQTIAKPGFTDADAIENIDIGGPAMIRSSAKNHEDVLVVVEPTDYGTVVECLEAGTDQQMRRDFAARAFAHTAAYDAMVAEYFSPASGMPDQISLSFDKLQDMRYGENPHQRAAFYRQGTVQSGCVAGLEQWQGKELSYNNVADTDAALECVRVFEEPACVIVKHANPCGVGVGDSLEQAYDKAFATDPTSAFGGIIAFNRSLDVRTLQKILDQQFAEVIVAPHVDEEAIAAARAKKNLRLLSCGSMDGLSRGLEYKRVGGGLLVQEADELCLNESEFRVVTSVEPSAAQLQDLLFAWKVGWFVKSNAIVYARNGQTIGVGAGQMSRVISAKIAAIKARDVDLELAGVAMASDAFFPFRDSIDAAAEVGITSIIQPGGSIRDNEVIEAANEHGIAMVFTGVRHFRH